MSWTNSETQNNGSIGDFRGSSIYPYFGWVSNTGDINLPFAGSIWIVSPLVGSGMLWTPSPTPQVQESDSFQCRKCGGEMRVHPLLGEYYARLKKARLCQSCFDKMCENILMDDTPIKEDKKNKRIEGMLDALGEKQDEQKPV